MTAAMTQVPVPTATITQPSWIIGYNPSNIGIPSINTATRVGTQEGQALVCHEINAEIRAAREERRKRKQAV